MKPIAWYDPTNGMVSTDKDSPLFTPLGQVWPLFLEEQQITADCPNCEYHRQQAQLWRDEAYRQAGHPLPEREPVAWQVYTPEGKYAFVTDDPAVIHPSQKALPLYTKAQK